jgi:signal transduction histidine kinase
MSARLKHLLTYFLICLTPLALLVAIGYWSAVRSVDRTLQTTLQDNLNSLLGEVDRRVADSESQLNLLAHSNSVASLLTKHDNLVSGYSISSPDSLDPEMRMALASLFKRPSHFIALTFFAADGTQLLSVEQETNGDSPFRVNASETSSQSSAPRHIRINSQRTVEFAGSNLRISVPVVDQKSQVTVGSILGDVEVKRIVGDVARAIESASSKADEQSSIVLATDNSARILYHTNHALQDRELRDVIPELREAVQQALSQGVSESFHDLSGRPMVATLAPLPRLNLAIGVAHERSSLIGPVRTWGLITLLLAVALGSTGAVLWDRYERKRFSSIERVTQDLSAIAKGELDRRIELRSSDDARAIADNINVVTEQLRAQMDREAESRQFESFVRLSAMLTHDLKNAIEALSLTVTNMEQHFDNEQFRADAMKSVAGATEKLKAIVARVSRPLTSLSGEHKRPAPTDLVPILRRVVERTAAPVKGKHTIEMKLPSALFALVDSQRIEAVAENLVLNAIDAMSEKSGVLTIEATNNSDGRVGFTVSDTGAGMSQTFIEQRLFRPFATTKRNGVGLGLYTCREAVLANGGSISVVSKQGAGTTFSVVLPSANIDGRN